MCSWVDNLFSASDSLAGAIYILEDFETELCMQWGMQIKTSSRCCMVAEGNQEVPLDIDRWPMVDTFVVLGHAIQSNGSIRACWARARNSMWKAFWANPGANAARGLGQSSKLALLQRVVRPQLSFRCSRWPPQRQIASEVDRLQQKMVASVVRLPRVAGEEAADYVRRRGRLARKSCAEQGIWSQHWFSRAVHWDDHLCRPLNFATWPAQLREHRGKQWLMDCRASLAPARSSSSSEVSVLAGRTGTRTFSGKVHTRWHDGVDFARSHATA